MNPPFLTGRYGRYGFVYAFPTGHRGLFTKSDYKSPNVVCRHVHSTPDAAIRCARTLGRKYREAQEKGRTLK